jgi:hypothetical protein
VAADVSVSSAGSNVATTTVLETGLGVVTVNISATNGPVTITGTSLDGDLNVWTVTAPATSPA